MNSARQSIHGSPNKIGGWRIGEQRWAMNSRASSLDGGGHMNNARQSINGSPNKIGEWRIGEQR